MQLVGGDDVGPATALAFVLHTARARFSLVERQAGKSDFYEMHSDRGSELRLRSQAGFCAGIRSWLCKP
jgi:hypothetical protein